MPFKLYIGPIAIFKVDNKLGDRFKVSNLSIFYFIFTKSSIIIRLAVIAIKI